MYGSVVSPHSSSRECAGGVRGRSAGVEIPHVEQEAQEEEEGVQFEDAGHVPEESVEQRKRTPMGREVAALSGNLGVYCSAPLGRQRNRSASSLPSRRAFVSLNPGLYVAMGISTLFSPEPEKCGNQQPTTLQAPLLRKLSGYFIVSSCWHRNKMHTVQSLPNSSPTR
eukprot:scaffold14716_cov119-Skeletonema_dohrnii-CCMP3373.AAC.1